MHLFYKYFNEQKWTLQDFMNNNWTKMTDGNNWYYFGKEKNYRGQTMNGNGLGISVDSGSVTITAYDHTGHSTKPYIEMYK